MSDEGFREIQLNGKQLIFLFMAVTVVSVVIFLFGVLVGRGVREGAGTAEIASSEIAPDPGVARGGRQRAIPVAGWRAPRLRHQRRRRQKSSAMRSGCSATRLRRKR